MDRVLHRPHVYSMGGDAAGVEERQQYDDPMVYSLGGDAAVAERDEYEVTFMQRGYPSN